MATKQISPRDRDINARANYDPRYDTKPSALDKAVGTTNTSKQPKSETPKKPEEQEKTGYTLCDPQNGTLFIGESTEKGRLRQCELHSTSGAHIKFFKDGGFEVHSNPGDGADNIDSNQKEGLNIKSSGDLRIDSAGVLTLKAREIRFESSAADEAFIFRSSQNIIIEAGDSVRINAANVAIGARNKLILASKGPIYMKGNGGVTIIEPKSALIPTSLGDFVDKLIETVVFGGL
jgi:hypothetical protein